MNFGKKKKKKLFHLENEFVFTVIFDIPLDSLRFLSCSTISTSCNVSAIFSNANFLKIFSLSTKMKH